MSLFEFEAFVRRHNRFLEDIAMETDSARDESVSARFIDSPLFVQETRILTCSDRLQLSLIVEQHLDDNPAQCKRVLASRNHFICPFTSAHMKRITRSCFEK